MELFTLFQHPEIRKFFFLQYVTDGYSGNSRSYIVTNSKLALLFLMNIMSN